MSQNRLYLKYYKSYRDKIYNYFLYRVAFNQMIAEDLCSEVFLRAFDKFDDFDKERSFQSWIYAIAHNSLCNYYRGANREVNLEEAEHYSLENFNSISNSIESQKIIEKIKKLDGYSREVLLLRFVDELSNSEIANLLGKNEGAIRTQISRALNILKSEITDNYNI